MHIIIIGGSGLIGRALTSSLVSTGCEVIVLSRSPEKVVGLSPAVRIECWDARTAEGWGHLMNDADAVVNLAGESISSGRWTAKRKTAIRDSRLNAGQAIVEAIINADHRPRVLIQASGVGFYGVHQDVQITEEAPSGKDFLAQLAVDWEASTSPVEALGVRRAIIRTGVVLSRKGGALPRMLIPFRFYVGGKLGSGRQWFPWIHINDEINAIRFLIENDSAAGPFNLVAPNPITNACFTRMLGEVMRCPARIATPAFLLRIAFGEMSTLLLDGQYAVPRHLLDLGYVFKFADAESALRELLK